MPDGRTVEELGMDSFLAEAELLARLVQSTGWVQYENLLNDMRAEAMEELAKATSEDFRIWQGVVGILASIISRPHEVIESAATIQNDEEGEAQRLLDVKRSLDMVPVLVDDL